MYISRPDDGGFGDGEKQLRGPDALLTLDNNICFEERGLLLTLVELDGLPASRHPVLQCEASLQLAKIHCHGHR